MENNKKQAKKLQVNLLLSLIIFITLVLTHVGTFSIMYYLISSNIIVLPSPEALQEPPRPELSAFLLQTLIISLILGGVTSYCFGRISSKPINKLINAINELADGNFDVRISLSNKRWFSSLCASFNRMAEELGSVEMLRSSFINDFSHEFKTPIVSIRGYAKLLQNAQLTEAQKEQYLSIIISESDRLSSLATNVLTLSKVENQKIVSESCSFNLAEQIRRCILLLEPKWSRKNIEFQLNLKDISFYGNEAMLSQVWLNLIDNAIKFSPENGRIEMYLFHTVKPFRIYFKIRDYGCGIAAESASHIFQKFYQEDSAHIIEGNGLGLTIAAKIIDLHNGKIQIGKQEEKGVSFEVFLPAHNLDEKGSYNAI